MSVIFKAGRRCSFLLLFFCIACSSGKTWVYREIETQTAHYNAALLQSVPQNQFNGIEVQFLRGNFGECAYLGVYSGHIPKYPEKPGYTPLALVIEGKTYRFLEPLMEGEQRVRLSEEATSLLLESLREGQSVIVAISGGYYSEIQAANFPKLCHKFCKLQISSLH